MKRNFSSFARMKRTVKARLLLLLGAGLACIIHGILPFAFERTGSQTVRRLHERLSNRCAKADAHFAAAPISGDTVRG